MAPPWSTPPRASPRQNGCRAGRPEILLLPRQRQRVDLCDTRIGGLALSHWLPLGARAIVVERAPRFGPLDHYVTLEGNGVETVRRMGIVGACQARAAPIEEACFYTASGWRLRCERTAQLGRRRHCRPGRRQAGTVVVTILTYGAVIYHIVRVGFA